MVLNQVSHEFVLNKNDLGYFIKMGTLMLVREFHFLKCRVRFYAFVSIFPNISLREILETFTRI